MHRALGAITLVILVATAAAVGDDGRTGSDRRDTPAAAPRPSSAPLAGALRVAVDPDTGTLVEPTLEQSERLALQMERLLARTRGDRPKTVYHADGTVALALPARLMSFSVVRLRPDGTLEQGCVEGAEAASVAESRP